jgi:hypothetical protein
MPTTTNSSSAPRALQHEKAALARAVVQEESLGSVLDLDSLRRILG